GVLLPRQGAHEYRGHPGGPGQHGVDEVTLAPAVRGGHQYDRRTAGRHRVVERAEAFRRVVVAVAGSRCRGGHGLQSKSGQPWSPPATGRTEPVTYEASGDARKQIGAACSWSVP